MLTDPIADYLTRLRNAMAARHRVVEIPASNLKREITKILFDQGYILHYKFETSSRGRDHIKIALKYDSMSKEPAVRKLKRVSKPGLRVYKSSDDLPRVLNGLGIAIVSTSRGLMTDKKARQNQIGGEIICYIY
ncbi:MAG: 30S ribosomal protein S8 [Flavobacteriales bacterium]